MSDLDHDSSTADSNGGVTVYGTGPIGQQIGKKITPTSGGGVIPSTSPWPYGATTSTGNGSTSTSTGNGPQIYGNQIYSSTPKAMSWNQISGLAKQKQFTKKKVRYVIVNEDFSTLELKELPTITPQEMIGLSKFLALVSTFTTLVLGEAIIGYNFNIKWSDIIDSLGIKAHFVSGLDISQYDNDNSEVLDILLYNPK